MISKYISRFTKSYDFSPTEQKELAIQLQSLSSQCEGSPVPLVLDSGLVVPPANLTDLPMCQSFLPIDLQPDFRPRKIEGEKQDTGPFLFTPIHFGGGSLERKKKKAESKLGKCIKCRYTAQNLDILLIFLGKSE